MFTHIGQGVHPSGCLAHQKTVERIPRRKLAAPLTKALTGGHDEWHQPKLLALSGFFGEISLKITIHLPSTLIPPKWVYNWMAPVFRGPPFLLVKQKTMRTLIVDNGSAEGFDQKQPIHPAIREPIPVSPHLHVGVSQKTRWSEHSCNLSFAG